MITFSSLLHTWTFNEVWILFQWLLLVRSTTCSLNDGMKFGLIGVLEGLPWPISLPKHQVQSYFNYNVKWTICGKSVTNVISFTIILEITEFLRPTLTFDRDGPNVLGVRSSHNNFFKCHILHTKDIWQSYPFHITCLWILRSIFTKTLKQHEKTLKHGIVGPLD